MFGMLVAEFCRNITKDPNGLWTVTLGPLEPNLYEYRFTLDGCAIADPGNDMPKPQGKSGGSATEILFRLHNMSEESRTVTHCLLPA
jgi:hypothetical protein